ncbi:MAG: hypothetical protein QXJ59_07295 [Thermofilaceae archaeon]
MLEAILKQRDDGAWVLLEERSLIDEKGALQSKDATYVLTPADVTPWLHRLSMVVLALAALCSLPDRYTSGVAALMLEQQKGEGFGHPMPILESTYWVVESLKALDRLASMPETARWVLECENESRGLSASLSSKNYFRRKPLLRAENPASARLTPKRGSSHAKYTSSLRSANSGFRRAPTHGVSSLEYTFYDIQSLKLLSLL